MRCLSTASRETAQHYLALMRQVLEKPPILSDQERQAMAAQLAEPRRAQRQPDLFGGGR